MNIKLQHVFSDIDGTSAQAIIEAILNGERDALKLAVLRDRRCHSRLEDIVGALRGDYRQEYLLGLKQSRESYLHIQGQLAELDQKIAEVISNPRCNAR
jgi:hypothetical protein